MSVSVNEATAASPPSRRLLPQLLAFVIPLSILILCFSDTFAVSGTTRISSFHLRDFLSPISTRPSLVVSSTSPPIPNRWISAFSRLNYTSILLSRWLAPGGEPCRDSPTVAISIPSLDSTTTASSTVLLTSGTIHEFTLLALDASHRPAALAATISKLTSRGPHGSPALQSSTSATAHTPSVCSSTPASPPKIPRLLSRSSFSLAPSTASSFPRTASLSAASSAAFA